MSNASKAQPEIILELDRPRPFVFNLNGLCRAEEALDGKSVFRAVNWKNLGVRDLRLLLWAGLLGGLADGETMTIEEAGALFHTHTVAGATRKLQVLIDTALEAAMPYLSEEDIAAVEEQKKKVSKGMMAMGATAKSTGSNSSRSASTNSA